jgi:hypothetical protein
MYNNTGSFAGSATMCDSQTFSNNVFAAISTNLVILSG